jgi:hypothetical protein
MQGDMAALMGKDVELPAGSPCWSEDAVSIQAWPFIFLCSVCFLTPASALSAAAISM